MYEFVVKLDTLEKVKNYISLALEKKYDITVSTLDGKYIVDGKSILGILSLNILEPLKLIFQDEENGKCFEEEVKIYKLKGDTDGNNSRNSKKQIGGIKKLKKGNFSRNQSSKKNSK